MQALADALPNPSQTVSAESPLKASSVTAPPPPPSSTAMRTLWVRMAEIFGHRWASSYGEPDGGAAETWAKGLAGLTPAQLAAGLSACIASADPWPPTLPEFRARCLGIPAFARVKLEVQQPGEQRSPFTRFVWGNIDGYAYRQADGREALRMLQAAYDLAVEARMQGAPLPEPVAAVIERQPAPPPKPASRETAEQALSEIGELLGRSPALRALDEQVMAEFGCSREIAQEIVESGGLGQVGEAGQA